METYTKIKDVYDDYSFSHTAVEAAQNIEMNKIQKIFDASLTSTCFYMRWKYERAEYFKRRSVSNWESFLRSWVSAYKQFIL